MIYFTFGVHKSASTYVYNLIKNLLTVYGHIQDKVNFSVNDNKTINFLNEENLNELSTIDKLLQMASDNKIYVIKTHFYPFKLLEKIDRKNKIYCFISRRNVVDRCLSLIDASKVAKKRQWRNKQKIGFANIDNINDALSSCASVECDESKWLNYNKSISMDFSDITLKPRLLLKNVINQLGFVINYQYISDVINSTDAFDKKINNFNQGLQSRGKKELDQREYLSIINHFNLQKVFFEKINVQSYKSLIDNLKEISNLNNKLNLNFHFLCNNLIFINVKEKNNVDKIYYALKNSGLTIVKSRVLLFFLSILIKRRKFIKKNKYRFFLPGKFKKLISNNIFILHIRHSHLSDSKLKKNSSFKYIKINNENIHKFLSNPLIRIF
jgi:hypothetical protein